MAGDYVGQIENAGKLDKVLTSLRWSAKGTLSGTYVLTDLDGEPKAGSRTAIPCIASS